MKALTIIAFLGSIFYMHSQTAANFNLQDYSNAKPSLVDFESFLELAQEVQSHRAERLLSLKDFLKKAEKPNSIILDTRSRKFYNRKHVKGAINLPFNEFDQLSLDSLMDLYAGKDTEILIYCNNNFKDKGNKIVKNNRTVLNADENFVSKFVMPIKNEPINIEEHSEVSLALNIPTYINLYGYGYKNVYELKDLVDVKDKRITFNSHSK